MMTLRDLIRSTIEFNRKRARPPYINVQRISITSFSPQGIFKRLVQKIKALFTGRRLVLIKAFAKSEVGAHFYELFLLVQDVGVSSSRTDKYKYPLSNKKEYMESFSLGKSIVKVRCECPDYFWRFAWYNHEHGALYGLKPRPYIRKTNRPPVNPKKLPGMCKHLMSLVKVLSRSGVLKP